MNMKKLVSFVLAMVLVVAMSAAAMAADDPTISVAADDSHTYDVYQIFVGDLFGGILSNVKWGTNGTGTQGHPVAQNVLDELAAVATQTKTDAEKLAVIDDYVDLTGEAFGTVTKARPLSVPAGYYLIKDKGVENAEGKFEIPQGDSYSLYVVEVVDTVVINPKRSETQSHKKVDDKNDSDNSEDAIDWKDSADYDVGDEVPFKLTGIVTDNYEDYETYKFVFHDEESEGLTFNKGSVKVFVDGVEIKEGFTVETEDLTDDCTFEVRFADLKQITPKVHARSEITVEYTSTLNEKAVIGSQGNPNTMYLEYSNNPNVGGEGETGTTEKDTVIVFTFKVIVNKVAANPEYNENDADSQEYLPLEGAGFTLYKYVVDTEGEGKWVPVGEEVKGEGKTTFAWERLDAGNYKLVETTTPNAYNTIADIEFTITAEHELISDSPKLTSLSGNAITGEAIFTPKLDDGSLTTNVENRAGTTLPETGGMGTTVMYIAGGLLVAAAVVLLIAKRRMNAAE